MFLVCHAFLTVHCSRVVTCWERDNLFAVLCVMFYCVFVTFPCGALGQVWYLIISIPDLCTLTYFISRRGRGGKRVIARHLILIKISMIKRNWDFRTYIRRYTSPNENFEYGYSHSNARLQTIFECRKF